MFIFQVPRSSTLSNPLLSIRRLVWRTSGAVCAAVVAALVLTGNTPRLSARQDHPLQLHFIDVGQGESTLLISPGGETILFDNGVRNLCDKPVAYLDQVGIKKLNYQVVSHYHDDHIGCTTDVLAEFPLTIASYDRGHEYPGKTYEAYVAAVGGKRRTAQTGMSITLDRNSTAPVTVEFVAMNGNGVETENENDVSLVSLIKFGQFRAEIGGDLSGYQQNSYKDIETSVAPLVGLIDVYAVHHHGSSYSSNTKWLAITKPTVGIISAGLNSKHGHPTAEALERLHLVGAKTFWTSEGGGVEPEPGLDVVTGTAIVEVLPDSPTFSVRAANGTVPKTAFAMHGANAPTNVPTAVTYAWSRKSSVYHLASCRYVKSISPENLQTGNQPPAGLEKHKGCPK